jgi:hypothetical protein
MCQMEVAQKIKRKLKRVGVIATIEREGDEIYVRGNYKGEDFRWRIRLLTVGAGGQAVN